MGNLNKVFLMGNLTRDVELRYIPSGTAVADIGLAVNERRKDGDEWVEDTTFVEVTLWARTAEIAAEFLQKGSPVFIEGRLKLDTWEAEDGTKRSKMKVVANGLQLIGAKAQGTGDGGGSRKTTTKATKPDKAVDAVDPIDGGDDIPF